MPVIVDGKTYYRTTEVCRTIGVSRNTLFRWLREDDSDEAEYRDWRGWRLIPEAQMKRMKQRTHQILVKRKNPPDHEARSFSKGQPTSIANRG